MRGSDSDHSTGKGTSNSSDDMEKLKFTENKDSYKFSSACSTYLTLLGYSIGMSDIWRLPFLVFRNGGGAFLIPFVVMIIVCGIPLYFLEYSISKFSGRGPYQLWDISPLFRGIGITVSAGYCFYMMGSSIFRCWLIDFLIQSFMDPIPWSNCDNSWNTAACRDNRALLNGSVETANDTIPSTAVIEVFNQSTLSNMTSLYDNVSLVSGPILSPMSAAEEFWQYKILQLSTGIWDFTPVIWRYFLYLFIFRIVILLGSIKSIKSIEKVIYVTATVPFFLTIAIFIRSLMLPGSLEGIKYFFLPDFGQILKTRVWIEATLMAFYTLAFGWGAIVLLGSHAAFKENCLRTAILLPIIDMLMAVFSGMVCFSVLGNMAHAYGVHVENVIRAGMATGLVAYITALGALPFPQIWSVFFFISTILTGIDSQLIPLDMTIQLIGDLFPRIKAGSRIYALSAVSLILFLVSLLTCTGGGAYLFLWNDWYSGAWIGPIVAFAEVAVVAWIYGLDRFSEDVYMMIGRTIPCLMRLGLAFFAPIIVLVIFFTSIVEYVPPKYGSYAYPVSARVLGWLTVASVTVPIIVQAVRIIRKDEGPLLKRIQRHIKPLDCWGPCDDEHEAEFHEKKSKYSNRTFRDLFYYNLFGKYPSNSLMCTASPQEMEKWTIQ